MQPSPIQQRFTVATNTAKRFGSGVATGFGNEAEAVVNDVRVVADVFRAKGAREGATVIKNGLSELGATEGGVKDALLGTFFTPIKNDIQSGRPDLAIGRAAFHIVTTVFPGDKVLRAASTIVAEGAEKA